MHPKGQTGFEKQERLAIVLSRTRFTESIKALSPLHRIQDALLSFVGVRALHKAKV